MNAQDIFLITSVINAGNKEWSYSSVRSVFNTEERFKQSLNTIASIRKYNTNAKILFVECSELSDEYENVIRDSVDFYIQCYENEEIRNACLNSIKKGYGELLKTKKAVEYLIENSITFNRLFKISGRYWLNEHFDISKFSLTDFTFNKQLPGSCCCPTVLYCVPYKLIICFLNGIGECEELYVSGPHGLEHILPPRCLPQIRLDRVGVSGHVAIDGIFYES